MISNRQHRYSANVGRVIANDFYAIYFNTYVIELENGTKNPAEVDALLYTSYCRSIPSTCTIYFTADFMDENLREMPVRLRLVEQKLTDIDNTDCY